MKIGVVDFSSQLSSHPGALERMVAAVDRQMTAEVSRAWGSTGETWCRVFESAEAAEKAGAYVLGIFDDADAAGALGYHDVGPDGKPYGKVFAKTVLDYGGSIDGAGNSISVTLSHEALELLGDPGANDWSQEAGGELTAKELCDAVEADSYQAGRNEPFVSNFLYPAWFRASEHVPGTRFDHMGNLDSPFSMTKGGYKIVMVGGRVSQQFAAGHYSAHRAAMKLHPASRTARRLARSVPEKKPAKG